ncbi:hypothetical protein VZ95_19645, partial [Elstera litoralis]
ELDEALLSYRDAEDTWISDKHSVALEDFMLPDGKVTTDLREILFHQDSIAYLHSLVERLAPPPGKFGGKTPDVLRLYAGFSAVHITISCASWLASDLLENPQNRKKNRAVALFDSFAA